MTVDIFSLLLDQGFVTRPQILDLGHDDETITALVRSRTMLRIGPGLFAGPDYAELSPEDQHVLRCHAVATRFPDRVAFSHQSAALLHGLPAWGSDLDHVHVTRLDGGRARQHAGVAHHTRHLLAEHLTTVDGLETTTPARAVWDVATTTSIESALVTADAALHHGAAKDADLERLAAAFSDWAGARRAKVALSLADGRAESPAESRARYAFHRAGVPKPVLQHPIHDRDGAIIAWTDFAWPQFRHVAEVDGLVKYGTAADLAKEKAREDAIRALGWGVTRIVWSQLRPGLRRTLIAELTAAMEQSRRQFGHRVA